MEFSEIKPYVRFVRILDISKDMTFPTFFPVDCRLFYVLDGKGKIKTEEQVYDMNKGDALIINAGHPYEQIVDENISYLAVNFDFSFNFKTRTIPIPPSVIKSDVLENVTFTDLGCLNTYMYRPAIFSIQKTLRKMLDEYTKKMPHFEIVCSSLMTSALSEIVRDRSENTNKGKKLNIEEIILYIQEHYTENLTNTELAKIFHFHPNYISEVFRKILGKSLHQYVMEVRISNAISMLETGKMSISEIASETGFYDSSYFSRYFKKITGVSPKVYK